MLLMFRCIMRPQWAASCSEAPSNWKHSDVLTSKRGGAAQSVFKTLTMPSRKSSSSAFKSAACSIGSTLAGPVDSGHFWTADSRGGPAGRIRSGPCQESSARGRCRPSICRRRRNPRLGRVRPCLGSRIAQRGSAPPGRAAQLAGAAAAHRVELLRLRFHDGLPIREIARRWNCNADAVHRDYARTREEFKAALSEVVSYHYPGSGSIRTWPESVIQRP